MDENRRSSISQADTLEEMGEFWDEHDFSEYDTDAPDVEFTILSTVAIEPATGYIGKTGAANEAVIGE